MSPKAFAAALRDFAAAVALSPDPAKSVAELAELLAVRADSLQRTNEAIAAAVEQMCKGAPAEFKSDYLAPVLAFIVGDVETLPDLDMDALMSRADQLGAFEVDDLPFPPVVSSDAEATAALRLYQDTGPEVAAFDASGLTLADWAALPDCDRAHHIAVHQQLAAKAAAIDSPAA